MKVLVACECSGRVREAFRKLGHDAWSCDIKASEDNSKFHIQGDVIPILEQHWDAMIAFPPCTDLCVSGAGHFKKKIADGRQQKSIEFFMSFANSKINKVAIENPVGIMSTKWRKPEQVVRPFWFGENSTKGTCLWLKNLPKLKPTNIISTERHTTKTGKSYDKWWFETCLISDLVKRAEVRSRTFQGIADAMAEQWGGESTRIPPRIKI